MWRDRAGQDLVEYTLLLGAMGLIVFGFYIAVGSASQAVWQSANSTLALPLATAPAPPADPPAPPAPAPPPAPSDPDDDDGR